MHPAFSVIFLTTLIGVGQGLFLALYAGEGLAALGAIAAPDSHGFYGLGSLVSLLFLVGGLVASFFHLGHPERAWRAATMWRTSWLSREVIVLPAFMLAVSVYGLTHYLGWHTADGAARIAAEVSGAVAALLCLTLFVCTSMIYACIKFLQEWASPLTLLNYFLLGCASGFTMATGFTCFAAPQLLTIYASTALVLIAAAAISRGASLYRNARIKPKSTLQSATGIRHPRVVQKAQGSMGGSFNTRQYFHGKTAAFLRSVKWIFLVLAFVVPALLLGGALVKGSADFLIAAFLIQYVGLVAERWFFFAQANHPQNMYYQQIS